MNCDICETKVEGTYRVFNRDACHSCIDILNGFVPPYEPGGRDDLVIGNVATRSGSVVGELTEGDSHAEGNLNEVIAAPLSLFTEKGK